MYSVIVVFSLNFLLLCSTIFALENVICSFIAQHVSGMLVPLIATFLNKYLNK